MLPAALSARTKTPDLVQNLLLEQEGEENNLIVIAVRNLSQHTSS
jgi:hypothetical protein